MKKSFFTVIFILGLFLSSGLFSVSAQQNNVINDSIYSIILDEWRSVKVVLPENYATNSSDKFEVVYLTDGEWVVNLFPFIYKFAKDEDYVPSAIIVALPNTYIKGANQRDRDFLPVHVESPAISGGADKFLGFISDELMPFINNTYRTNGTNSIYGHSYGGVFTTYVMLTRPQLFNTYYATDLPIGWNNDYLIKMASDRLENLPPGRSYWLAGIESTYKGQGIHRMDSVLKLKAPGSFNWKIATFPNEKHNSVRLKAMYDGIKYAYSGYGEGPIRFHPMSGILLKDKPCPVYLEYVPSELRYEVDGTIPDKSSPMAESFFTITGPAQLVLKSFSIGGKYDRIARGNFEVGEAFPAVIKPGRYSAGGLKYSLYKGGTWDSIPDFKKLKPVETGITDSLFSLSNLPLKSEFALLFEGYIEISEDGYYLWAISSHDGSKLFIADKLIIDNDGIHSEENLKSYIIPMQKGFYPIRIEYFQKEEKHNLQLYYVTPGSVQATNVPLKYQYHRN